MEIEDREEKKISEKSKIEIKEKEKTQKNVNLVIFGATGDLSRIKLLPSLFSLWIKENLPNKISITAFSRRDWADEDYRIFASEFLDPKDSLKTTEDQKKKFLEIIKYHKGDFHQTESFEFLQKNLRASQADLVLYYIATPPSAYDDIFQNIKTAGLNNIEGKEIRICIEKPFGSDLKTAEELNKKLQNIFVEKEIYRIDHYLAKDALRNVLIFRFTNRLFGNSWNKNGIEKISIRFFEDLGVEKRGEFYDSVGALRDVGQNHILQMLAMVAMKNPKELIAENVRREREDILSHLKIYTKKEIKNIASRGQYKGYQNIPKIKTNSETETYFQVKAFIDDEEWRDVPFYLEGGKSFKEKKVEIEITFRPVSPCVCGIKDSGNHKDTLIMKFSPDAGIDILFWAKKPGVIFEIEKQKLSFSFTDLEGRKELPEAYETVLFEAIKGDPLLFPTSKEVEAAWRFITPIVENWDEVPLKIYEQGAELPEETL